jgi:uncharacterized protein
VSFWAVTHDGVRLRLKVRPQARRAGIEGVVADRDGEALSISVTAAPEDGKANTAVIALLAKSLDVAKSTVSVTLGTTSRRKTIHVAGNGAALAEILESWREAPP